MSIRVHLPLPLSISLPLESQIWDWIKKEKYPKQRVTPYKSSPSSLDVVPCLLRGYDMQAPISLFSEREWERARSLFFLARRLPESVMRIEHAINIGGFSEWRCLVLYTAVRDPH